MAKTASKDGVAADLAPVDYEGGIGIIRNRISAKKKKVGEINGEISGLWDQVEKKGINKEGARIFMKLDGMESTERRDVLRTIQKMSEAAGWDTSSDLVDNAEGNTGNNIVKMPAPASSQAPGEPKDDEGGEESEANATIDPATFKATAVNHITEHSDMSEADAYVVANRLYDDLTSAEKKKLTRALACAKAEDEMADWPTE